jgi:S1-C subfamily serine protease
VIEPLLLAAVSVVTHAGPRVLTRASGFFFERNGRLWLVTSRHVLFDEASDHHPDRIELELHLDAENLTRSLCWSMPLFRDGRAVWRQARDSGGDVDVAVLEIDAEALPPEVQMRAFTPAHLQAAYDEVPVGSALLVVGFPLGFHDTLHHLPVVRQAAVASAFGVRFQGQGYFLTDARTHRGTSGAAVVMRSSDEALVASGLPWKLLGVHAGRMDMMPRDEKHDEVLGLNCTWYADVLLALTAERPPVVAAVAEPAVPAKP